MRSLVSIALLGLLCQTGLGVERFPPPDFVDSGHELPVTTTPPPRSDVYEYADVAVLFAALAGASYLALRTRSRHGLFALMIFSLLYFGFYRKGCVCPIGAVQNVALALVDSTYAIPLTILAFFLLPLMFTLVFGRTFCAAVCPLGAIQDVVLLRPLRLPDWLAQALGLLPFVYLAVAVLLAATGSAFVICRQDPFVSFFRFSGGAERLIIGGCVLLIAAFVGRPYCRFLCPYGAILRVLSSVSKYHVTITPDECIRCRLCEDSCPFGAIEPPTTDAPGTNHARGKTRLAVLVLLIPVLVLLGAYVGSRTGKPLSRVNATVRLAERIRLEEAGAVTGTIDSSDAFRGTGTPVTDLYQQQRNLQRKFLWGGAAAGAFVALVIGLKLIRLSVRRRRSDYQPNRASCLACGRCFEYCPIQRKRRAEARGETVTKT